MSKYSVAHKLGSFVTVGEMLFNLSELPLLLHLKTGKKYIRCQRG